MDLRILVFVQRELRRWKSNTNRHKNLYESGAGLRRRFVCGIRFQHRERELQHIPML